MGSESKNPLRTHRLSIPTNQNRKNKPSGLPDKPNKEKKCHYAYPTGSPP